jgi:hypothetical protein
MRKITQEAARALLNGETYRNNNTHVDGGVMLLHGNAIARFNEGTLIVSNAGWHTTTTKERINGLLQTYGSSVRVYTKNGMAMITKPYSVIDKTLEWSGEWTEIRRG